uniref:Pentacotripeptide-repeat region of PRORP domain-containing protein n=1 Tax=Manihot esculenta TaxID=3983 RepID=A0A2C9WD24_MANES
MKLKWPKSKSISPLYLLSRRFTSTLHSAESNSTIHCKIKDLISRGLYGQTLVLYTQEFHRAGVQANAFILPSLLKACSSSHYHHYGLQLHCVVLKSGFLSDPVISNALMPFYAKSSDVELALKAFDAMPSRDSISWNSIINCCVQKGRITKAFELFKEMYRLGFVPKSELLASFISLSVRFGDLKLGRIIHALVIVDERIQEEVFVLTSLVDWYFKCGYSSMALRVFDRMEVKNEISWTAMVSGCIANFDHGMAVDCFRAMQINGVKPNRVTLIASLPACAELGCIKHGKEIHGYAIRQGFDSDRHFLSSLIHMYCISGKSMQPAKLIFERSEVKDVVLWSSIIGSYSRSGHSVEAINLFKRMREEGIGPNSVTLLAVITACTTKTALELGNATHGYIVKCGLNFDVFIGNALINMYAKCGCLVASHQIFKEMHIKDSVSWSTLIAGYGLHGYGKEALSFFHEMQDRLVEPDAITLIAILSACNHAGLVEEGKQIFDNVKKEGKILLTIEHYACLIDLLGKSGKIDDAFDIVRTMPLKPSASIWSSLVSACKTHGRSEIAEILARQLIESEPGNAANHTSLSGIFAESKNWHAVEEKNENEREKCLLDR